MSVEDEKVCCNCKHCIRSRDEKYDIVVCHCEVNKAYLSYAEVMAGWCNGWKRRTDEQID